MPRGRTACRYGPSYSELWRRPDPAAPRATVAGGGLWVFVHLSAGCAVQLRGKWRRAGLRRPPGRPRGQPSPALPALSKDSVTRHLCGFVGGPVLPTQPSPPGAAAGRPPSPAERRPLPPTWQAVTGCRGPAGLKAGSRSTGLPWLSAGALVKWVSFLCKLPSDNTSSCQWVPEGKCIHAYEGSHATVAWDAITLAINYSY